MEPTDAAERGRIRLRPAVPEDLATLMRWDEQPHVTASDPNDDWEWERELGRKPPWREQLMAELEGRPLGFVQIIDPEKEETRYWGDAPAGLRAIDIWIGEAEDLGKGYGTGMMRQAIGRCFAAPEVKAILIDPLASNVRAHRFYERLGFRFAERRPGSSWARTIASSTGSTGGIGAGRPRSSRAFRRRTPGRPRRGPGSVG